MATGIVHTLYVVHPSLQVNHKTHTHSLNEILQNFGAFLHSQNCFFHNTIDQCISVLNVSLKLAKLIVLSIVQNLVIYHVYNPQHVNSDEKRRLSSDSQSHPSLVFPSMQTLPTQPVRKPNPRVAVKGLLLLHQTPLRNREF